MAETDTQIQTSKRSLTADLPNAAVRIVDSKSFDNSILCTNESVLIVEETVEAALVRQLRRAGGS